MTPADSLVADPASRAPDQAPRRAAWKLSVPERPRFFVAVIDSSASRAPFRSNGRENPIAASIYDERIKSSKTESPFGITRCRGLFCSGRSLAKLPDRLSASRGLVTTRVSS